MQDFFNWQGVIGTIVGFAGLWFAYLAYKESSQTKKLIETENERKGEHIAIVITDGEFSVEIPFIRRQDVTRSEIQGRLGTIPVKTENGRYSIDYTNTLDFYEQIDRLADGSHHSGDSVLKIICTKDEFKQFVFPKKAVKQIEKEELKQLK